MEAILTGENLTRKIIHVKCCYLCLKEEEIVNHLVIHSNEQGNVGNTCLMVEFNGPCPLWSISAERLES